MTVTVRVASPDEYPAIGRLTVGAYDHSGQLGPETDYRATLADTPSLAAAGTLLVAVDEPAGTILGTVLYLVPGSRYAELSRAGEAEFRMLAVDPAAQGRGVARALVDECLRRARAAGCSAVVICYRDFVTRAERLYQGLGFERSPQHDWRPLPEVRLLGMRYALG